MADPKDSEESGKEAEIDLDALDRQIDSEIDNLFVPAAKKTEAVDAEPAAIPAAGLGAAIAPAAGEPASQVAPAPPLLDFSGLEMEKAAAGEGPGDRGAKSAPPAPPIEPAAPSPQGAFDLDSFQAEIDKEIDTLFTPAAKVPFTVGRAAGPELSAPAQTAPPPPAAPPPAAAAQEAGQPAVAPPAAPAGPAVPEVKGEEPAVIQPAPPAAEVPSALPKLVEAFNAAYLTLDWDFSPENLYGLELALSELEPYARKNPGSEPLFKLLKAILPRLRVKPHAASPPIVELIRDAQGLLAHTFLVEGPLDAHDRDRLRVLLGRFRALKEKALAAREARDEAGPPPSARAAARAAEQAELLSVPLEPPAEEPLPDRWSVREIRAWVDASSEALMQAAAGLDPEVLRLRQIEEVLGKSQALGPVVARLASIRTGVSRHLEELRNRGAEWKERAGWISSLEKAVGVREGAVPRPQVRTDVPPESLQPAPPPPGREEPFQQALETMRESVYVFYVGGRPFALPASGVVRIHALPPRQIKKLQERGYATLGELKPLFRSFKTGVLGEWKDLSTAALKAWRFMPVGPQVFQMAELPPISRAAIFISTGTDNGVIFADVAHVGLVENAEISVEPCSSPAAIGTVPAESGVRAEVLDLNRVFASRGGGQ